jgi:hypothetical protein
VSLARYAAWVTAAVAGPLAVLYAVGGESSPTEVRSAAFGASLAGLNAIVAYGIVVWAQGRSTNVFMGAVLGGMLARMGALLAAVVCGLSLLDLHRLPLVTSLMGYFMIFLVLEMRVLHRRSAAELS